MSSGSTQGWLQIVHADFSAPSGDATRGRSLVSLSGLVGEFHFAWASGDRFCAMPLTKSALCAAPRFAWNIPVQQWGYGWSTQFNAVAAGYAPSTSTFISHHV
jgi:hypothetical protein